MEPDKSSSTAAKNEPSFAVSMNTQFDPNSINAASSAFLSSPQTTPTAVCVFHFASDSFAGAFMGSFFGYGYGLFRKKGLRGSFAEAGSYAKTFAVLSGVHSVVHCLTKNLRRKDDAFNAAVAGCCTGLAVSFPGTPQGMLQSCLTFGAFSYLIEGMNKPQPAMARSVSLSRHRKRQPLPLALALPLADEFNGSFASFCDTLKRRS